MATREDVECCLKHFNEDFPRPKMGPLWLSASYDARHPRDPQNPKEWPGSWNPGVYVLFDERHLLLYVGKASCGQLLGGRIGKYFDKHGGVKDPKYSNVRHLATIALPVDRPWEAGALEEFLISKLNPPLNQNGRTDTC